MHYLRPTPPPHTTYPNGRDWTCTCGFFEPEDARPSESTCPDCGRPLSRVAATFNVVHPVTA